MASWRDGLRRSRSSGSVTISSSRGLVLWSGYFHAARRGYRHWRDRRVVYRHFGPVIGSSTIFRVLVAAAAVGLVSAAIQVRGPLVVVKLALLGGLYLLVLHILGEITGKDFGLRGKIAAEDSA